MPSTTSEQVVGAVTDTVAEVMPKGVVEILTDFFATPVGHIASIALLIVLVLLGTKIVLSAVRHAFGARALEDRAGQMRVDDLRAGAVAVLRTGIRFR